VAASVQLGNCPQGDSILRTLVTIQRVLSVDPIEGADAIEVAQILGWRVVVKKGEVHEGDLVCYGELDSIFPAENPDFAFLEGKRLRTKKLRGQISQGIVFPIDVLKGWRYPGDTREEPSYTWHEGQDVTDMLGVKLWQPVIPACLAGTMKGPFPSFIPKTDEMRIQAYPRVLQRHAGEHMYVTEKLDGSSVTYYIKDGEFGVCSRNIELKDSVGNAFWIVARKLNVETLLRGLGRDVALQGELIGPGVQGNKYALSEFTVYFYGIYEIGLAKYLDYLDARDLIEDGLHLKFVPFLFSRDFGAQTIDEWVAIAEGKSVLNNKIEREGIVIRAMNEKADIDLGRLSVKAINPRFLLKYEDS